MRPEDIRLDDWMRLLVGEVPASFFIELLMRSAFLFLLLVVAMRLMGKRMAAELGRNERAAMVSLAAAIGVPLQAPDRGLVPAIAIAVIVVLAGRLISSWAFKSQRFEEASQGNIGMLVVDGVMDLDMMRRTRISQATLFAILRGQGIRQLGEVKRLYMEAAGDFTCIRNQQPAAGLSILPEEDSAFRNRQAAAAGQVCRRCGALPINNHDINCRRCGAAAWEAAVC